MAGVWHIIVPQLTEYTNLIKNPSFELNNNDNWDTAGVGSTLLTIGGDSSRGVYKLQTSFNNVGDNLYYDSVALTAGTTYTLGFDHKAMAVASNYTVYFSSTADNTAIGTPGTFTTSTSEYQRKYYSFACATTDNYRVRIACATTHSNELYLDGVSLIATTAELTYFDGDTDNCRWSGGAHSSTSICSVQARNVGVVTDLQDYNLRVQVVDGVGTTPARHHVAEYASYPGAEYKGHKVLPRYILLTNSIYGTSLENLHSKRKDIVDLFKHDLVTDDQPIILRYTGANSTKPVEIKCYIDQEFGVFDNPKIQKQAIRLACYDPYFYNIHDSSASLTGNESGTRRYFVCKVNEEWTDITPSGADDPGSGNIRVRSIALGSEGIKKIYGGYTKQVPSKIYVSGYFLNWNGDADSDYIALYNPETAAWSAIEAGTNGYVRALSVAPNGYLYACGEFTQIGSASADRVAFWDGSSWNAMGAGLDGIAYDIHVARDGKVYVVGNDTTIGGVAGAAYVSYWSASAWNAMDTGLDAVAYKIAEDGAGNIYIGGAQTGYVTKWDGSAFTSLAAPSACWGLKAAPDGTLYAGLAGAEYIRMWNGQSWLSMGGGFTTGNYVYAIDIDADGLVWVGGDISAVGGLSVNGLVCWNGYNWVRPDIQLPSGADVYEILCNGNDVYIGFNTASSTTWGENTTVTNNGTARSYPEIVVINSAVIPQNLRYLRNATTGKTIYFNYDVQPGETVYINFAQGKRSIVSTYYGNIWNAASRGSQFSDFYLLPGSNNIRCYFQPTTLMSYIDKYESIDGTAA